MSEIYMDAVHLSKCAFLIKPLKGSSKGYFLFVEPDMRFADSFMDKVMKLKTLNDANEYDHKDYHPVIGQITDYNNLFVVFMPQDSRYDEINAFLDQLAQGGEHE